MGGNEIDPAVRTVAARFPATHPAGRIEPIPPARLGFSGSRLWRIESGGTRYCLKRWPPEHPDRDRLAFIHRVLQHVAASGLTFVPAPLADAAGQTIVECAGALWELTPWLAGTADYSRAPTPARLMAAMTSLARFHQAAATLQPPTVATPRSLVDRQQQADSWWHGGLRELCHAIREGDWPQLADIAREFVALVPRPLERIRAGLQSAATWRVPLQPCIRDIWHDHVLFLGDRVSGIVDYGALRVDTVACDVARLAGSLAGDDAPRQAAACAAYEHVRPLSAAEADLVPLLDASTVVLGGLNWLTWIYLDGRHFADRPRVEQRLAELTRRLRFAAGSCLPWPFLPLVARGDDKG